MNLVACHLVWLVSGSLLWLDGRVEGRFFTWPVWVAILLLAWVGWVFITPSMPQHDERHYMERSIMAGFIIGLKTYQTEYNRFPVEALASSDPHATYPTRGAILTVLHPDRASTAQVLLTCNPHKMVFFDPMPARGKKNGMYDDEQHVPVLVDRWGEPYHFALDLDGDGTVPNPDTRNNKEQPLIEALVIAFSSGPDRDPNTWEDNVMSWK